MTLPRTGGPEWSEGMASPWDTVNQALRLLDAFARHAVIVDRDLTAPPGTCADGDAFLVDSPATGAWYGQDGMLAIASGANASNGWNFATVALNGNQLWVDDEEVLIRYLSGVWTVDTDAIQIDLSGGINDGDVLVYEASSATFYPAPQASGSGVASGTSFPVSPTTGDKFFRSDRKIEYVYDGTRWLSTQIFTLDFEHSDGTLPISATSTFRARNPWAGVYDIYVETASMASYETTTTAANYFTVQITAIDGATAPTNVGSTFSTQNNTQNSWETDSITVNQAVTSAHDYFQANVTETGTASAYVIVGFNYRLVG